MDKLTITQPYTGGYNLITQPYTGGLCRCIQLSQRRQFAAFEPQGGAAPRRRGRLPRDGGRLRAGECGPSSRNLCGGDGGSAFVRLACTCRG